MDFKETASIRRKLNLVVLISEFVVMSFGMYAFLTSTIKWIYLVLIFDQTELKLYKFAL